MGEFSDLFDDGTDQKAKANLRFNADVNPDEAARVRQLSSRYGLPPETLKQYRHDYEAYAKVDDAKPVLDTSPKLRSWLATDQTNAQVAHDDLDNMGLMETLINSFKRGIPALKSLPAALQVTNQSAGLNQLDAIDRGELTDESQMGVLAQQYSRMAPAQRQAIREKFTPAMRDVVTDSATKLAQYNKQRNAIPLPGVVGRATSAPTFGEAMSEIGSDPARFILGIGPESLIQSAPGLLAAIPAGIMAGPVGAASTIGGNSALTDYASQLVERMQAAGIDVTNPDDVRTKLRDPEFLNKIIEQSGKHAGVVGAVDALSGGIAGKMVLPGKVAGKLASRPLAQEMANIALQVPIQGTLGAVGEAGGELAAGDQLQPGQILAEAFGELFGTPGEVVSAGAKRIATNIKESRQAEQTKQKLAQLDQVAAQSKLRERDPAAFEDFVAHANEDSATQDIYIDAHALMQSGMGEQIAAASPSVAAQLQDALAIGGDIRIPFAEYTARIAGTDLSAPLQDHIRLDPTHLSAAEAAKSDEFVAQLHADTQGHMDEVQGDAAFKQSMEAVKADIKTKLSNVDRFTDGPNDAYATMVSRFYAVTAAKMGKTPEQLYAERPLTVQGERIAGGNVLEQAKVVDQEAAQSLIDEIADFSEVSPDGLVTVYHRTSKANAEKIRKEGVMTPKEDGLFFSTKEDGQNTGYGDAVIKLRIPADKLQIDDMFDGEAHLRLPAKTNKPNSVKDYLSDELNQDRDGARGAYNPSTDTITLLKNADLSTFLHESGHFFLEASIDLATQLASQETRSEGEQSIVDDTNALLKWFGVENIDAWNSLDFEGKREFHEQFARGFESYLFEGKAPSLELQGIFQRFRAWMLNIYRDLRNLNVELSDEVRSVMDRMLATTDEIVQAEQSRSMAPLFASAEQAGMSAEQFKVYHDLGVEATNTAIQDVQARTLRDLAWSRNARGREIKRLQKERDGIREQVEAQVRDEVMSEPVYRVWEVLTRKATDGQPEIKLSRSALADMDIPDLIVGHVRKLRMTSDEGVHPDVIAEQYGFSSGDEMVRTLAAADTPKDAIEGQTDSRMLQDHGELSTPEAIEQAADKAIHNEARARFVATELAALSKATGKPRVLANAAREFAKQSIAKLIVRNIRPNQYAAAESRAAKASQKASRAGDLAKAAAEKRNQLVNTYLTREAYSAQDEVEKGVRYLKKFDSDGTRKSLDVDFLDQIDALLERFDLRTGQSLKAIDKRAALATWVDSQREQGIEPDIPPALLNEAFRKSYKDMTLEEMRGLIDSVKQIEHIARLKHRLLTARDQREYEAARDEIAASINDNAGDRTAETRTPTTTLGKSLHAMRRFYASHVKAATWARIMDGGKDGGPVWEYFVRSANERGDMETTMRAEATRALSEIMDPVFKLGRMGGKGKFFASVNRSLNREAVLAIALNSGNEGNLQRLLGGEGWTIQQIAPVLQSMTKAEWQAVQAIWDHFESYRPQIAAKERRVYGKEPNWVDPKAFTVQTADGESVELKGGYYPIKYDPEASQRAEEHADAEGAKRQLQGAYTSATTRRSFTKSRTEEVKGRPLLYNLSGMYSGVNDVIHDLAWHEWLIDVNRLMRSKTIDTAIRGHYGPEVKAQFKTWIRDVAEGEKGADNAAEAAAGFLRKGISIAGLGFNVMSAAMQPLGITQSIVRVGPQWIGRGISRYIANPKAAAREANEKSSFMANRSRTRFRELNELRNKVEDQSKFDEAVKSGAFFLMMRFQQMVDVPTWHGAYRKAIIEGNNEDRAIALADQAVIDSQGGGQTKDLSAIERGGPFLKLFTVFYSFMNTAFNVGVAQTMTPQSKAKLAADYLLLYVMPPVLGYMLKQALTPGDDDLDDPEKLSKSLIAAELDYMMGMMVIVREFSEAAKIATGANDKGRDYTGPAGLRFITDTVNLAKQLHQGEFDDAFRKAAINIIGDMFGLPSAQVNRTITGTKALIEGETSNPAAVVFGFQKQ